MTNAQTKLVLAVGGICIHVDQNAFRKSRPHCDRVTALLRIIL